MPARRRTTLLSNAPRAQRDELDAARIASDIAEYQARRQVDAHIAANSGERHARASAEI